jgi:putative membrane protein
MRQVVATASIMALLAAAPLARAQPPGQNMVPGPSSMPNPGMMGNPNTMGGPGPNGPNQGMMPGQGGMAGPGMMGPNAMGGPGGPNMGGPMMGGGSGPGMMGPRGMPRSGMYGQHPMHAQLNEQDRKFVEEAASAGLAEVQEGHLAMRRAALPAVREFGRWMVTDHTELGEMLDHHAQHAGLSAPSQMNSKDRESLDKLEKYTNGAEFDQHYLIDQVEAHKKAIELFKEEAQSGANPELRWFAGHVQPMLTQHLAEAQELRSTPESASARSAEVTAPAAPMPDAKKVSPKLQEGTSPAVRHSLNAEGAKRIEEEGK